MLNQVTKVAQLEVTDSSLQILIYLCVFNGDVELARSNHRTNIPFDHPTSDMQMQLVNQHLDSMGQAPVTQEDLARIEHIFAAAKEIS